MAAFCVNTHSRLFKDTAKRLDISEDQLELIAYKYGNQEGTFGKFPTDEYILDSLQGKQDINASKAQVELWNLRYSQPRVFETIEEANQFIQDTQEYFDNDSIVLTTTNDGKFRVSVAEPYSVFDNYQEATNLDVANDRRMQKLTGLQADIDSIQSEIANTDRRSFLNNAIRAYNLRFEEALREIKNGSAVTSNDFASFVSNFNSKYASLINAGIISALDTSASQRIIVFDSDGRAKYNISKLRIRRNPAAIKKAASDQLRSRLSELNRSLNNARNQYRAVEQASLNDFADYQRDNGANTAVELPDQMTADEVYQRLSQQYSPDSSEGKLSRLVFDSLKATGITFRGVDMPPYWTGRLIASENVIEFNKAHILDNTLLHEAIHAVTVYYMSAANREGFSNRIKIAIKEIEECYDLLKNDFLDQNTKNGGSRKAVFEAATRDEYYGLTSATELVAEITRPSIVSLIRDYDARHKGQNVFQRLINAIAEFFGINKTYGSLERTLKEALVTLITNPNKALMDRYALENRTIKENVDKLNIEKDNIVTFDDAATFNKLIPEEYDSDIDIEYAGEISRILDRVQTLRDVQGVFTQSPIGTVFKVPTIGGYGWLLLNGSAEVNGNTARIPFKALSGSWFQTHTFDLVTAPNGAVYMTNIKSLFDSQQQAPQQQSPINIWAGSNENADLSNMAQRPFTYNGRQYSSVEYAFQSAKLEYAAPLTQQSIDVQEAFNNPDLSSKEAKKFGNKIVGLDRARWDADKFGIMKELIKASFQQNPQALQRLLSTGDAVLTHNQESSVWKTEFPRILMEVRSELRAEQQVQQTQTETTEQEPLLAPPSVEREFHTKEVDLVTKIDNLFSGDIDASEISAEANKAVDWISDQLTQYMEDHELIYKKFFEDNPSSPSKEEVMKKLDGISSRREMLETVGLDKMIEFYKEEVLLMTDENADIFDNMDDAELDKYDAIKDNIEGLIQLGYSRFLGREGFGFTISDVEGETFSVTEERSKEDQINPDDFNGQADIDGNEEVRNQQEHWQIESATRDIMDNASAKVKQAIADCYILEDNNKVDENGNKKYDIARDNLNRNERVVPIQAVRSIVKWTQGALTLSQMVTKLESRLGTDPWISQIVTRLKDTTGNEADFQSQFFNTFCKHFQPYSIVKRRADGTFYTMVVNAHPALNDALNALSIQYKTGTFPLVNEEGIVQMSNVENLAYLRDSLQGQGNLSEENRADTVEIIGRILETIGMPQPSDAINRILTNTLKDLVWANTKNIVEKLTAAANERGYNPLQYTGNKNGIRNYLSNILRPFTNQLEDTLVSSVFDSGKMYQSYITPSWTTKLFTKMHLPDREFKQFILNEFGQSEWFIDSDAIINLAALDEQGKLNYLQDNPNVWRLPWIGELMRMSEADRQKAFQHKVQLNFNKQNYMRGMNDLEYVMSVYTEYFAESSDAEKGVLFGNYRFPMISNKPSNEFIRFIRHTGIDGRVEILDGLTKIFHQELSRIQTVEMRNLKEGDAGFIANFDANGGKGKGLQFNFLDYLNEYLNGSKKDTALGKLIDRKLHATEANQLTSDELTELDRLVQKEITNHLDGLADRLISQYKQNGLFEALKGIEHIGKTDVAVEDAIREFAWNDNYAEANILEILVTDKAFYKNEEDLQKRLAQVHSPGIRGNWEATDFKGKPVSDGKVRALKLADYAGIISDTIDNVEAVFDKKIAENPNDREGWEALKESVLAAYRDINVVDGQAFVSPTAYRKKAIAFGEWTKDDEEVYKALLQGKANLAQIKRVFNPRKPFTYGKVNKSVNAGLGTPIKTLNYGVQYKNSEYLLIMADALLRGQETGRPNLLGALFDVMEESAKSNPTRGIDFVVFESGVKTGLTGAISINEFINDPNGREKAFTKLWNSAFKEDGSYNEDFIDVLDAEDYTTQQTVPEHFFLHGGLQWGSQIRAMATSDLETTFNGEPVLYEYVDPLTGNKIPMDAQTIRAEWERNTAAYIQKGIDELSEELGLNDNMSIADRNILISKLLQREILSNQRYGVDLLLACSVDENGNFRIPLGDPIQSKRIEQLLNSIVKNRINKQKVEGGNLVEVTNFGTSKKLEIRYKDKEGNLLTSKREYLAQGHIEEEFKQYLKENQYGIAYHECYAPAWAKEVFQKFADEKGSVDVEAIRMLSPDLLKMFGYRIPTEDKYSTAPYMIVGFLPQEAGDGFMQPWETTVIDGSDFDVDKKNLMRMVLNLKSKLMSKEEFYESKGINEDTEETRKQYRRYRKYQTSAEAILEKIGEGGKHTLSSEEEAQISARVDAWYDERVAGAKEDREILDENALDHYNEAYEREVAPLEARYNELDAKEDLTGEEEKELQSLDKKIDRIVSRLDRKLEGKKAENERRYNEKIAQLDKDKQLRLNASRENFLKDKKIDIIRQILDEGIFRDSSTIPENQRAIFLAVKQAYLDSMFEVVRPKEGTKGYLNNKMFNMQWAIATHASTADKMLNPGNFDPQKRMGYMVAANRLGYAWSELEKMKTSAIKELVFTSKNLMDFDVQTQFYKQNAVAGQILGIFAVAKSAHAMFEGRNYGILVDSPFSIDGMEFSGAMHYDVKYDRNGVTLVGKHLGSLVGASADAVKDPVLNFMNINKETINVLNTALRLGLDFDTASLLLSSKAVSDVLDIYRRKSLSEKTSFDKEVRKALRDLEKKDWIGKDSPLKNQDLTKKEMIWAITGKIREGNEEKAKQADQIVYKILNAVYQLSKLSQRAQPLTDLSRLNSVTSAPGPLHINTIASDRKLGPEISMDGIIRFKDSYKDIDGNTVEVGELEGEGSYVLDVQVNRNNLDRMLLAGAIERFEDYDTVDREMVFNDIPSLRAFYRSYEIVKQLFKDLGFTTASDSFNNVLAAVPEDIEFSLYNKEKLLSSLADFFQSYILIQSGVVKSSWLKNYAQNFVKEYVKADYKSQERFRKNPLIQAIQPTLISKEGEPDRYALKIETTGMEQSEKDALSAGWIQLEKQDPELSHKLFVYNFFRGGIGFNPKTFMGLVPIQVKEKIQGYIEAYTNIPRVDGATVIDQWVRNNWMNNDLVTPVNLKLNPNADVVQIEKKYIYNTPTYIRTTVDGKNYLYRLTSIGDKSVLYKKIDPLGNNGEYLEMYETNATVSPFDNPQRGTLEIQESDHLEEKADDPMADQPTVEEQTRELVDFYQTAYDTEGTQEREETSNDESFDKANKDLDITVNKDKFDEILEDFC